MRRINNSYLLHTFQTLGIRVDRKSAPTQQTAEKLGFVSAENISSMVNQMFDLKKKGDNRTSVNILRLLAVLCAPGIYHFISMLYFMYVSYECFLCFYFMLSPFAYRLLCLFMLLFNLLIYLFNLLIY